MYSEKAGILDGEEEGEVDLASLAYQIWKNATDGNAKLKKTIEELPDVVYATKSTDGDAASPEGALVYLKNPDESDALVRVNSQGEIVTQSPISILRAAECTAEEAPLERPNCTMMLLEKVLLI